MNSSDESLGVAALSETMQTAPEPERSESLDFDRLYREHFRSLWRTARALGVTEASAPDVVQEVFIIAMRRAASFEGRSTVRRWLVGILIKVSASHRRKAKRDEPLPETLIDTREGGPAQSAMANQAKDILLEILDDMEPNQRTVWVLTEAEGLSAQAIAEMLDTSPNTVSSRLRLARKQFDRHLARVRARDRWRQS